MKATQRKNQIVSRKGEMCFDLQMFGKS